MIGGPDDADLAHPALLRALRPRGFVRHLLRRPDAVRHPALLRGRQDASTCTSWRWRCSCTSSTRKPPSSTPHSCCYSWQSTSSYASRGVPGRTPSPIAAFVIVTVAQHRAGRRGHGHEPPEGRSINAGRDARLHRPPIRWPPPPHWPAPGVVAAPEMLLVLGAVLALVAAGYFLLRGYTLARVRSERSLDLLHPGGHARAAHARAILHEAGRGLLQVTIPTTTAEVQSLTPRDMLIVGAFMAAAFAISIAVGQWWRRDWWKIALAFWVPFTVLLHDDLHQHRRILHGRGRLAGILAGAAGRPARQPALVLLHPDHGADLRVPAAARRDRDVVDRAAQTVGARNGRLRDASCGC